MAHEPNPEAIAWYVMRSEDLLEDLRDRIQSLQSRAAQIAGFSGAVLALAGGNAASIPDALHGAARSFAGSSLLLGSLLLIGSLVTAVRATLPAHLVSAISASEVVNYATERFTHEVDLWRVQVRAINGLRPSIESMTRYGDEAAERIGKAEYLFLSGLLSVGIAFATLVLVMTF